MVLWYGLGRDESVLGGHARPIRNHQKPGTGASWAENFRDLELGAHGEEAFVFPTLGSGF